MIRRMAEILHEKVGKSDEAAGRADGARRPRRRAVPRGVRHARRQARLEGHRRDQARRVVRGAGRRRAQQRAQGAFERFVSVGRDADAAAVAKELARTRGADADIAEQLEEIAVKLKDLDALGVAHDLMVGRALGPARADELVRQAEVLVRADVSLTRPCSTASRRSPACRRPRSSRCSRASPRWRRSRRTHRHLRAPGRPLQGARRPPRGARARRPGRGRARRQQIARAFFELALGAAAQEDTWPPSKTSRSRATKPEASTRCAARSPRRSRPAARARATAAARAARCSARGASLAHRDLNDVDKAFGWLGDALVTHVDDAPLDALEALGARGRRFAARRDHAHARLEEVFDGPLVRKLLARRAQLRRDKLVDDKVGAAVDLKKLHDLSPSDTDVMDELSRLYTELGDYRGMVQLYEDQILRGRDPTLARRARAQGRAPLGGEARRRARGRRRLAPRAAHEGGRRRGDRGPRARQAGMLKRPKDDSTPKAAEAGEAGRSKRPSRPNSRRRPEAKPVDAEAKPSGSRAKPVEDRSQAVGSRGQAGRRQAEARSKPKATPAEAEAKRRRDAHEACRGGTARRRVEAAGRRQ